MTRFREPFPILPVDDIDRAIEFYCSTFGFEQAYAFEGKARPRLGFGRPAPPS